MIAAKCTQLLVDSAKTNIDLQDNNGDTALHLAGEMSPLVLCSYC
jgi:ankyrin repeat protein